MWLRTREIKRPRQEKDAEEDGGLEARLPAARGLRRGSWCAVTRAGWSSEGAGRPRGTGDGGSPLKGDLTSILHFQGRV